MVWSVSRAACAVTYRESEFVLCDVTEDRGAESTYDTLYNTVGPQNSYRVASVSRIDKMIGLFCKRAL